MLVDESRVTAIRDRSFILCRDWKICDSVYVQAPSSFQTVVVSDQSVCILAKEEEQEEDEEKEEDEDEEE